MRTNPSWTSLGNVADKSSVSKHGFLRSTVTANCSPARKAAPAEQRMQVRWQLKEEAESVHESVHSPAPAEGGSVVVGSGNDGALQGYSQRIFSDASCRWWEDPAVLGR